MSEIHAHSTQEGFVQKTGNAGGAFMNNQKWILSIEQLPKKPGKAKYEQIPCLVFYEKEIMLLVWNCEHICWDDPSGDDYFCNAGDVSHWMPLPEPPVEVFGQNQKEREKDIIRG